MGTPDIAVTVLDALRAQYEICAAFTRADKPKGRGKQLQSPPVKVYCESHGIPVHQPTRLDDEAIEIIQGYMPDVIAVVAYGRILPPRVLAIPRYGCINLHVSLLPKYRGAAPIQWALINGETVTGVTVMLMDEGIDTGDILSQQTIEVTDDMTHGDLLRISGERGGPLMRDAIYGYVNDVITPIPQRGEASLAPVITKEQERVDWHKPAIDIIHMLRALSPSPLIYFTLRGKRIKIAAAHAIEIEGVSAEAGTILRADGDGLVVAAGQGAVCITRLQAEGKGVCDVAAYLRGNPVTADRVDL